MATYDSVHTGEQVDNAVDIVLGNKSKGSATQPIYLDANGAAQNVNVDATPTDSSANLVQSGGVFTQLSTKYAKADISTDSNLGTSNTVIPSQGAVKSYVDTKLATKQDVVVAGDGIVKEGNTLSISTDNDFMTVGKLDNKWSHFVSGLDMGYGTETIEKMENAKRSSFDGSKFPGLPNIVTALTSDGIMTKLTIEGGLDNTTGIENIVLAGNKVELKGRIKFKNNTEGYEEFCYMALSGGTGDGYIVPSLYGGTGAFTGNYKVTGGTDQWGGLAIQDFTASLDDIIDYTYTIENGNLTLQYYNATTKVSATPKVIANFVGDSTGISIYRNQYKYGNVGILEYDLKYWQVLVNGVTIFSGNKTGIDTIKPSNFTAITSGQDSPFVNPSLPFSDSGLTITADGVASGFTSGSTGNHIEGIVVPQPVSSYEEHITFSIGSTFNHSAEQQIRSGRDIDNAGIKLYINTSGYLCIRFGVNNNGAPVWINNDNTGLLLQTNTSYNIKITWDGTQYKLFNNDNLLITSNYSYPLYPVKLTLGNGYHFSWGNPFTEGSIDLNAFKIYVNGDLVYQPCLKIPYTLTKDGKKIVDSIYRDRVEDEYTQAGYTPYYTLSDTNYTMATVKESAIVDSYDNGMNKWTKYANLDFIQQGSCTSGTAVQFAKPFRDANYALSVPYTSGTKTATGFTPSFTGNCDYIAKGKCNLNFPQE